ncbi:hypothetical protein niasHS_010939 [Heterodera schachtii]|uniref:Nephrocystin-4 n=1 Tax=Heterodera schachtii TaxID=97005 RepID=A0ABD2IT23_HETSC
MTERHCSVSVLESWQNSIEVELPSARVSAFPRRVVRQFMRFPFPKIIESDQFAHIDPMEKRQIRMELERIDKFGANEVSIQFLAFKKLGSLNTIPSSHRLFFSFQFFSFEPIITESLFLDAESAETNDGEEPNVLYRNGGAEEQKAPGLIVRFVIGSQKKEFLRYLLEENVHIHIWEADSLFYVGSTSVPLQCLLRQGSAALLSSIQAPVVQSAFLPSDGRNHFAGLLFCRMANVGKNLTKSQIKQRSLINYGKAQSLKSADGMNPLERFLAFQRMDLEQRSLRIFGGDEEKRMREWAKLRGRENGPLGQVATDAAAKFLFSEELAAYRALRREGKALALLRTVFSSVTTSLRAEAIGGQLVHLQFQLRNPFPEDCICAMEVNDQRLSPVISKTELEYLRKKHQKEDFGRFVFEWEEGTNGWTTVLRGMERVQVALRFDTGTAERAWASPTEARAFFRRLPHGNPLAILEVSVSVSRPFLSEHFQWFSDERRKLVRAVPISRSPLPKASSVRVSDPAVLCSLQPSHSSADAIQLLRIECLSRGLSEVRDFSVFFYADPFLSELFAVHRFSVHSIGRLHSMAVQGQEVRVPLGGFVRPPSGELVRLFCSSAVPCSSVGLLPSPSFASSAHSLSQFAVLFRPLSLGHCQLLISAVATSTCAMLGQWLLGVTVDEPNIAKVFEVIVPRDSDGVVRKRIPLHNPLGIPRQFRLVSSDPLLLSLPIPLPPPIPPNSSFPLPLLIQTPQARPCTVQSLLFVEDIQTGAPEGAFAVNLRFE